MLAHKSLSKLIALLLGLVFQLPLASLRAQTIDDHDNINPTAWQVWSGQSFNAINATVANGYRIVDIRSDDQFGSTFTVTYVHNSGTYGTGWWYLINVDSTSLGQFMSQNNARPTRLIAWDDGNGGTRLAAVMVPNNRAWWWYVGVSMQSFFNAAIQNGARPVSVYEYRIGANTYTIGSMIANTGADYRPWWLYSGMSFSDIGLRLGQTQGRLYSLQLAPNGTYNGLYVQDNVGPWLYWVGISAGDVLGIANNSGARVYELQNIGGTYLALMLRNDNDLERRVGDIMRGTSDGTVGAYLKRVNGPVLASQNGGYQFEPASTLKTLLHYHAMDQVRLGNIQLSTNLTVNTGTIGSCPQATNPVTEPLSTVLRLMMENSDNNRTMAIDTRFGRAAINATAQLLGMSGTSFNHTLGCGGPTPNRLTLSDVGHLHEVVANGSLGTQRTNFYNLMLEFGDNYAGGELNNVINQESASVGLSAGQLASFRAACRQAFKGGSYTFLGPTREWRSWASWISLPFWTNSGLLDQEYVTGAFVDSASNGNNANTAFNRGAAEVLRDEIRAAMVTWRDHVTGSWSSYGTGCFGSNGLRPSITGAPTVPNIGANVSWTLSNARASAFSALIIGYSNTHNGAQILPYDLTSAGMPTCRLYTEVTNTFFGYASSLGIRTFTAPMPAASWLVGLHFYAQYAVFDTGANQGGVAWSNAQDMLLGGQR